jgi:ribonuclease G
MRFRPTGGLGHGQHQKDRDATQARAEAVGGPATQDKIYDARHAHEIERAENQAAGLPPEGAAAESAETSAATKGGYREPNLETPVEVHEEEKRFAPVPVRDQSKGLVDSIRNFANTLVKKAQRLIKPVKRIHKEVVINAETLETRVAVLEEGKLEEFNIERTTEERLVGSIFKGKVRNLEDGLKAAFVDIGFEKNAFLHYWDIVPSNVDSGYEIVERSAGRDRRREKPKITQKDIPRVYPPGSDIIVQVTKGPIGTKGPRVTTNLTLPGRYLILLPNSDQSGISRKIENQQERQRLKDILRKLSIPDGMGVIMRTVGEGQQMRYFVRDLALLLEEWKDIQERIKNQSPATCVFQEPDLIERTVRDFLTEDVERIVVDSGKACDRMREMISKISRRSADKIKVYSEPQPIFQESTILKVNMEAAEEISRQLRLRNMGGLIVLDFIDMKHPRDRQHVYQKMREGLRRDKAKTHVLPISQLGLMEMTRQRHSESVHAAVYDDCPYCKGRGKVKSALTMSVEIQRKLGEILKRRARDESDFQLLIILHPTVYDRLRTEDEKHLNEMEKRYFGKLIFRKDPALHAEQFKIMNAATNEELASVGI